MENEQLFAYAFVALAFVLVIFGLPFVYYVLSLTNRNVPPEVVESMFAKFQEAVITAAREAVARTPGTFDDTLLDMIAPQKTVTAPPFITEPTTETVTTTTTTTSEPKPLIDPVIKARIEAPIEG